LLIAVIGIGVIGVVAAVGVAGYYMYSNGGKKKK